MPNELVSMVIPIYKVEAYLRRCLDSIVAQDYRPLEVWLVDDGSPDHCPAIADEYAEKYPDLFQVIHQPNAGLSAARNAGIAKTSGPWICFVDSDDYVEPNYVSSLMKTKNSQGASAAMCNFYLQLPKGFRIPYPFLARTGKWRSGSQSAQKSLHMVTFPSFAWNKLYPREIFGEGDQQIQFPSVCYEDIAVQTRILCKLDSLAYDKTPLYHYCLRGSSIIGTFTVDYIDQYLNVMQLVSDFLQENGLIIPWQDDYDFFMRYGKVFLGANILFHLSGRHSMKERWQLYRQAMKRVNIMWEREKEKAAGKLLNKPVSQ